MHRLKLPVTDITMIDVGSGDGKKSLKKYAFDDTRLHIPGHGVLPSNMAAIEGNEKKIPGLEQNVPAAEIFLFDFSDHGLKGLNIQKKYHVALLCEVLEHLHPGEGQMNLLRDTACLVLPGGGMHVTFPRTTGLSDPIASPWGHKCKEVPRHDVMNVLTELFEDVTWAQAGPTVNFFALGRKL